MNGSVIPEYSAATRVSCADLRRDCAAIAARFALRDGATAHAYLESRAALGKVLLTL